MAATHYISMLVISTTSFIFGLIPVSFTARASRLCPFFLSLILCLGAGILLATSIVHMLTEVQEKLEYAAQLYFCAGFLLLYAFDEICHILLEVKASGIHREKLNLDRRMSYGAVSCATTTSEHSPLLGRRESGLKNDSTHTDHMECHNDHEIEVKNRLNHSHHECHDEIQCHVEIGEPCSSNPVAKAGLLIALTMHSVLEGISIGVQNKFNETLLILGSVTFHKVVLSFCLGLELHSHGVKTLHLVLAILLFSIGSSIGIFIGTLVTLNGIFNIDAQMQALAAGSLLYVAAFEVLPRERFRWQHQSGHRAAGLGQLFFVVIGFVCITLLHLYVVHPHDQSHYTNETESIEYNVSKSSS